jgi:hypothetical protein
MSRLRWGRKPMNDHVSGEDLAAYVDGLLGAEKRSELESHFSGCPACMDELVEIAAITGSRDKVLAGGQGKIPGRFLLRALGGKDKAAKSVLHLRLVFEVAAVFVVVIFIGYLFLDNNRFWQPDMLPKKSSNGSAREISPAQVGKGETIAPLSQAEADLDAAAKTKNNLSKSGAQSTVAVALKPQPMKKNGTGKSLAYSAAEAEQNRERQEKPGAGTAMTLVLQEEKMKDEASPLRASAAVPQAAGQVVLEDKKLAAALARKEIAGKRTTPPVRIEGDVAWTDLRNPELVFAWSWLQKDLALELQIDGSGAVIAVVPQGNIDPLLAKQAENEAKKLLFSVSEKKLRRAVLIAD